MNEKKIDNILVKCYSLAGFFDKEEGGYANGHLVDKVFDAHTQYKRNSVGEFPEKLFGVMKELTSYKIPTKEDYSENTFYKELQLHQNNIKRNVGKMERILNAEVASLKQAS